MRWIIRTTGHARSCFFASFLIYLFLFYSPSRIFLDRSVHSMQMLQYHNFPSSLSVLANGVHAYTVVVVVISGGSKGGRSCFV